MGFRIPFEKYKGYNLVVNGWNELVYGEKKKSWTGLNAGVLLIRNCEWSMELIDELSGLIYLLINNGTGAGKGREFREKVYLEDEYDFLRYWLDRAGSFENVTRDYDDVMEGKDGGVLRRRHAEGVSEFYGGMLEERIKEWDCKKRRSLITHFTGCEPCSGEHNPMYSWGDCYDGMVKALNFGDNQITDSAESSFTWEKVYLEDEYDFQRYWLDRAGSFENLTRDYDDVLEGKNGGVLRRRHAEGVSEFYGEMLAERIKEWDRSKRRSLITHFTGCEPCSGEHNPMYS
ncbi:unnamed protein product [Linum tenue]|uniref:Uncharacterized protein n=1 Tax=Linum tenue TaxID=586396 RepID=A0AAV0RD72_9ROSI|nr:unnamed protein product [Linum tenue]